MNIDTDWVRTIVEIGTMLAVGSAFIWSIKLDTNLLKQRLDMFDERLDKVDTILERLSDQKSRIDVIDERMLAQGKRMDDMNRLVGDRLAFLENGK